MVLRISLQLRRLLLVALSAVSFSSVSHAGLMLEKVGYQTYRNLAENRYHYKAGATDVPIYGKDGAYLGTAEVIPDFSAVMSAAGGAALAGGQSWMVDCAHASGAFKNISFGAARVPTTSPIFESYSAIKSIDHYGGNDYDLGVLRLSKVVTDAVHWEVATDERYVLDNDFIDDKNVWRIGAGGQDVFQEDGTLIGSYGAYSSHTAGTVSYNGDGMIEESFYGVTDGRGNSMDAALVIRSVTMLSNDMRDADDIASITGTSGDSGSPYIVFNEDTQSFQFIGVNVSGTPPFNTTSVAITHHSPEFYDFVIEGSIYDFQDVASVTLGAADAVGDVKVTYSETVSENVRALAAGKRGDTSTVGISASDEEMWDALDWRFSHNQMTINIDGDINTGAGSIQFNRSDVGDGTAEYRLDYSKNGVFNFITAGYIIQEKVNVISTITGQLGDEWRLVGENARLDANRKYEIYGGTFHLQGSGNNDVDLNIGVGLTVYLERLNGYAARNVQINTGSTLVLSNADQVSGTILFGAQGGSLDLNGNDYSRNSSNLYTLDEDGTIGNFAENTAVNFNYTVTGADPLTLHTAFIDTASLSSAGTSSLSLAINSESGSARAVTLNNTISIAGGLTISDATHVTLAGRQVEIADITEQSANKNYTPAFLPDEWYRVYMNMNHLQLNDSSKLTLGSQVTLITNDLTLGAATSFNMQNMAQFEGTMRLNGTAIVEYGASIKGSVYVNNGASLSMQGYDGVQDLNLSIASGANATLSGSNSVKGVISNKGTLHIEGMLGVSQAIDNDGTLSFAENALLDVSMLTAANTYTVFEGMSSESFGALNSNNIRGNGSEKLVWSFNADGTISEVAITNALQLSASSTNLAENAGGFVSGSYSDGASITTTGNSSIRLTEAHLSAQRLYVESGELEIIANGHQLSVDRLLLGSGANLKLQGDALDAATYLIQENEAVSNHVTLDLLGGNYVEENQKLLTFYTGDLSVENGTFELEGGNFHYNSLYLNADAKLNVHHASEIAAKVIGAGTIDTGSASYVNFHDLSQFSGKITSSASEVRFATATSANMNVASGSSLYLDGDGSYSGAFTGSGSIVVDAEKTVELSQLAGFSGNLDISANGHLTIAENAAVDDILFKLYATLELADGVQLSTSSTDNNSILQGNIILGTGSTLSMESQQWFIRNAESSISGDGNMRVHGLSLTSTLKVDSGATLHVLGTKNGYGVYESNQGSFQLAAGGSRGELDIYGTVISEAGISSMIGGFEIEIFSGGNLELRQGPVIQYYSQSQNNHIVVNSGATLTLGNQADGADYGGIYNEKRLAVRLSDGAKLAAYGEGTVIIRHSMELSADSSLHIVTKENQIINTVNSLYYRAGAGTGSYLAPANKNVKGHVSGNGQWTMSRSYPFDELHITDAPHVHFGEGSLQFDKIVSSGQAILTGGNYMIVGEIALNHADAQLAFNSSSVDRLIVGVTGNNFTLNNVGNMTIAAHNSQSTVSMTRDSIQNVHISHVRIADQSQGITLNGARLSDAELTNSSISLAGERSVLAKNTQLMEGLRLNMTAGAALLLDEAHIASYSADTFTADLGVNIKEMLTIRNSSMDVAVTQESSVLPSEGGDITLYRVADIGNLLAESTLEGYLYLDMNDPSIMMTRSLDTLYGFILDGVTSNAEINHIVLRVNGQQFDYQTTMNYNGNMLLTNFSVPEPTTASLSLLGLTALLLRRRRREKENA